MKHLLLCFAMLITCSLSFSALLAQTAPVKEWDKTLGGNSWDYLQSLQQTADGGYILGGYSNSGISGDKTEANKGSADYWVVKLDGSGNKEWDKTVGGSGYDEFYSLRQTADGGYILGGSSFSDISGDKSEGNKGGADYWVVKLDGSGNKQWDKTIGGSSDDYLLSLQQTSDGGYILGGFSNSGISGDKTEANKGSADYWVIKLDGSGNKEWDNTVGGSGYEQLYSLQQTADGGYILGGYSHSGISGDKSELNKGSADYWVVKLDGSGNKEWDKTLGGSSNDYLNSLQQTADGGYILGGESASGISGDKSEASKGVSDYWVVKLDGSGNKQWDKTLGGSSNDYLLSLQQTADGGYLLGGGSHSGISGDKSEESRGSDDYWVVKLDGSGNKEWDKTVGGSSSDVLYSLQQTADGGYILGGYSGSGASGDKSEESKGSYDYWIVKLNHLTTYYRDGDGDGFGNANDATTAFTQPDGYVTDNTDCDDTKLLYADNDGDGYGAGDAVACGVESNSDCNDEDASVHEPQTYYADNDGDGFGDANNTTSVCSSTPPDGYVTDNSDCDDTKLLYADNDSDGFGAGDPVACGVESNSDCNDEDASVNEPQTYYYDGDGDGYGDANNSTSVCSATPPDGYVTDNTDCDDTKILYADNDSDGFGAGSPVACGVESNSDCNDEDASVNEPQTYYYDGDGDGYGDGGNSLLVCTSTPPDGYVTDSSDCDDTDNTVYPGAPEACDGKDNNCNDAVDEGCQPSTVNMRVNDKAQYEGNSGKSKMRLRVILSQPADRTITVDYHTENNTAVAPGDYVAKSGTLTFQPGDKYKNVVVSIKGDTRVEPDETFSVVLSNASAGVVLTRERGTGTILNNDGNSSRVVPVKETNTGSSLLSIQVSPNPANSMVQVVLSGFTGKTTLKLTDLQGKLMRVATLQNAGMKSVQQQWSVSDIASGTYLVVAQDERGNKQSKTVVVVH